MTPLELERQYSARGTVPDVDVFLHAYRDQSAPMYTQLTCVPDVRYGPHADERLDLFTVPGRAAAPLFVFIHGGYWRALTKEDSSFMARSFTERGIAVAVINYALAPGVRLEEIVAQCRRAIVWLHHNATRHGIDVDRITVGGSSAGGHLGAMLLARGWQATAGVPENVVKSGALVSGLFDLEPVQQTVVNSWLRMDAGQARSLSPIHQLPPPGTRLLLATAEADTDEFKRQSLDYAAACKAGACEVRYLEVTARNHFDVIMDWMDADAALTQHTWTLMD